MTLVMMKRVSLQKPSHMSHVSCFPLPGFFCSLFKVLTHSCKAPAPSWSEIWMWRAGSLGANPASQTYYVTAGELLNHPVFPFPYL